MTHETITGNFTDNNGLNGFIKCDPTTGLLEFGSAKSTQPIVMTKEFVQFHLMPLMAFFVSNGRLPDPDYFDTKDSEVSSD